MRDGQEICTVANETGEYQPRAWDIPAGPLGIISLDGSRELAGLLDEKILERRQEHLTENPDLITLKGFMRASYLLSATISRFASGEGKVVLNETIRGHDIYILADIGNYSCTYNMYGTPQRMSPDDHYQDIKRVIGAIGGKARRINVIMPLLYEGRQHKRYARESLDCAMALQELLHLGVSNIITFDAHDPRVQNAIPLEGFESLQAHYQLLKALLRTEKDLIIDRDHMAVVSPDEGGMERNIYFAGILGLDLGMFYKRRDYTRVVDGRNPIVRHEYLGDEIAGKDILIADDIISSGESVLEIAMELKERKARRIFVMVTFAQLTQGIGAFDRAYRDGIITRLVATNLTYRPPELLAAPWYLDADLSKFLSFLVDTLNHDGSISPLINPSDKIKTLLSIYRSNCVQGRIAGG